MRSAASGDCTNLLRFFSSTGLLSRIMLNLHIAYQYITYFNVIHHDKLLLILSILLTIIWMFCSQHLYVLSQKKEAKNKYYLIRQNKLYQWISNLFLNEDVYSGVDRQVTSGIQKRLSNFINSYKWKMNLDFFSFIAAFKTFTYIQFQNCMVPSFIIHSYLYFLTRKPPAKITHNTVSNETDTVQ